jgi:hypothetical protein
MWTIQLHTDVIKPTEPCITIHIYVKYNGKKYSVGNECIKYL